MKGKTLENLVLAIGLVVIGTAVFLMYFAPQMVAARLINVIFSAGFIIYIAYSYILSNNLNGEIRDLEKHVGNLKEEVARLTSTVAKQKNTINQQSAEINTLNTDLESANAALAKSETALKNAKKRIKELEKDSEPEQ